MGLTVNAKLEALNKLLILCYKEVEREQFVVLKKADCQNCNVVKTGITFSQYISLSTKF